MRFVTPISFRPRYTYELPSAACVEQLTSDFWTWEFVREGMFVFYLLVPFSCCLMLYSREWVAMWLHIVLIILVVSWGITMFVYDLYDISSANAAPGDANFRAINFARDPQWCLWYGGQPGTQLICTHVGDCTGPAIDPNTFDVFFYYKWRFAFNILLILLFLLDLALCRAWYNVIKKK